MQASIITIGNSKGIRIPKPLLEESGLSETVDIKAKRGEIRITPAKRKVNKGVVFNEEYLMSLSALSDWNTPEEDKAWETFTVGDVVLVAFPYADFSAYKIRPALLVGKAKFNNFITCQITSKASTSQRAIQLKDKEFRSGGLKIDSYIRPDKLFTIEQSVIQSRAGVLVESKIEIVKAKIRDLFSL